MPHFNLSDDQIWRDWWPLFHTQHNSVLLKKGGRKGVDVSDLQTGKCRCRDALLQRRGKMRYLSLPTGDLAGFASRYEGLELEERMLYPEDAKRKVTVTLPSGKLLRGPWLISMSSPSESPIRLACIDSWRTQSEV